MNYSSDDSMVRVDFFRPSGKWYSTEAIKWKMYSRVPIHQAIKEWRAERVKRKERQRVLEGYGWAMAAFFVEHLPLYYIEDLARTGVTFGERGSFDVGAYQAIEEIEKLMVELPRIESLNRKNEG